MVLTHQYRSSQTSATVAIANLAAAKGSSLRCGAAVWALCYGISWWIWHLLELIYWQRTSQGLWTAMHSLEPTGTYIATKVCAAPFVDDHHWGLHHWLWLPKHGYHCGCSVGGCPPAPRSRIGRLLLPWKEALINTNFYQRPYCKFLAIWFCWQLQRYPLCCFLICSNKRGQQKLQTSSERYGIWPFPF